jgi:glycosyltransferase involved in cell wall biosynthesis
MRIPEQALTRQQLNKVNSIDSETNTNLKLVWIGELVPRKNIDVLLEALRKSPNLELTVIGDGPLKPTLKDKYEDLLSNGVVNFTGKITREEVFSYLKNSDILVHTSYREGTATTIVEAISNGNFVVAIDIGGHSCLINETTGILLPLVERSQLIEELVTTLKRLEVNRELLKKQKLTWTWEDTLEHITRNYV